MWHSLGRWSTSNTSKDADYEDNKSGFITAITINWNQRSKRWTGQYVRTANGYKNSHLWLKCERKGE